MGGGFQIPDEVSVDRIMSHGLGTVNYVSQMHEYIVYGHGASWNEDPMSWRYDADQLFRSKCMRETKSYRRLRQWYSFSSLNGRVLILGDLADMRANPKEKLVPRPGYDYTL